MKRPSSIKLVFTVLVVVFLIADGIGLSGCANMIPPSGGLRDSLPPVLVEANPDDSTRNFRSGRITLVFNEFVELNNVMENLIISPTLKNIPVVDNKLRTVTIRIKDTLEENTTYSLNFGSAIRDVNEGNELKDFTYIFTTGPEFDTLRLSGRVILAHSGGTDSTLIVMLHTSLDDSAVIKDRPRYYTRVNRDGNFTFNNLPSGTFAIYTLKDEGGSRKYLSKSQLFGFAEQPVESGPGATPVTLYAYVEEEDKKPARSTTAGGATGGRAPRANTAQEKILRVGTNIENGQLDLLNNLEIRFVTPLRTFDSTKIRFTDEQFNTIPNPSITLDTSRKMLSLKYPWSGNLSYNVIVDKDFAEDTLGRKLLRNDTLSFRTKKESDYGTLKLRFLNLDMSKNPVLLFVQNDQVKYTHIFTGRDVNIRLFVPGEYDMRILFDENRNGKWDPGEFFGTRRQPEKVQPLTRKLNVKPNWDNEIDITL
ncbi:MAG TPA: Ig-like domain-containing protein [Chitinophagaceae bacterium]